jgi:hypothetical protein
VLPDGHEDDAVVVVMVGAAVGGAVALVEAVGVEPELELVVGLALPQAARAAAANPAAAREIQVELLRVTCDASVN